MQSSPNIHAELRRCTELLDQLGAASSPEDLEEKWQRFLGHLERVWNKCENHFGRSPRWNGWKGRYEKQRKADPLLSYLTNARGAHEHTVASITEKKPASIGIGAGRGSSVFIKHLEISPDGNISGDWDGELAVTFTPAQVAATAITNRGRTYVVPTSHLGDRLPDTSLSSLGRAGFAYYQSLVEEADRFFVK